MSSKSLYGKAVSGAGWSFADSTLTQGISFVVNLVLARILMPEEYGLVGLIMIFINVLNSMVDSGLSHAIIRKVRPTEQDYYSLFIANFVLSIAFFLLLYFFAPIIAQFFGRTELIDLTRVMGLTLIINALTIVQSTLIAKKLDFKTSTKASLVAAIGSGVVGISMALGGYGVWSIVAQSLSRQALNAIVLWVLNSWLPKLQFSWNSFKEMWTFGWKLLTSSLIDTAWREMTRVVVGKYYSPASLGQFTRAEQYASLFSSNLTTVVQRVSYPALAEIQDEKVRLRAAYRKVIKVTMFVTAISMFALGAVSEPLIYCLIGPKWHEAATYLPIICLYMSMYPLHAINLNMLQVQGRSDLFLKLEIIKKVIAVGPLVIGIFVNVYWMLIGSVIVGIISFFLNSYYTKGSLGYSSWAQLRDVAPSYAIATLVAVSVYFFKYLPLSYYIILPVQVLVGAGVFFLLCYLWKLEEYQEAKSLVYIYINKILHRQ